MKKLKAKLLLAGFILVFVIGMSLGLGVTFGYSAPKVPTTEQLSSDGSRHLDTKTEHTYKKYVKSQEVILACSLQEIVVTAKVSKPMRSSKHSVKIPVQEKEEVDHLGSQINDIQPLTVQLLDAPTVDHLFVKANLEMGNLNV